MPIPFDKPATTYQQQLQLLESRGLIISNSVAAEFYLKHINYYRLGAYWLPFEKDHSTHEFQTGTTFEAVINLYIFDRELRLLLLDAIERLEVSIRANWAYEMGNRHNPHAHLDSQLGYSQRYWTENYNKLVEECRRADEIFIRHLKNKYSEPLPPIWAVSEVMSFGLLSRWYNNLKPMATRKAIAKAYGIDQIVLESWLRHLSSVRNFCAHHARVWNREFTVIPEIPTSKPKDLYQNFQTNSRKLYNTLVLLLHCMDVISPEHSWRQRLIELLTKYEIPVKSMGFPDNWQTRPIWKGPQP